jgi:hypothetical protein
VPARPLNVGPLCHAGVHGTLQRVVEQLPIECHGIVCDEKRLSEIDSGSVMVAVDRHDIQRITSRYGLVSPHPMLQVVMGSALTALACFPAAHLIDWIRHGGAFFTAEAFVIPFAVIGLWLVFSTFRKGRFLEVESARGRKRLAFQRDADPAAVDRFLAAIEERYALRIERETFPR